MDSKISKSLVIARGLLTGFAVGTIARLWMRWISTDPEFSWSGTILIVGAFTIFFTTQSIVSVLRTSTSSRRKARILRAAGLILTLPIFTAAGGIMFPTVALASVAIWTGILQRRGRSILLMLSLIIPTRISLDIVGDFGWTIATLGRILIFVLIYILVILATRPTLRPDDNMNVVKIGSFSRKKRILIFLGVLLLSALFLMFTVGVPGG